MSLFALAAFATVATAGATVPAHTVTVDHRGQAYRVDYRPLIETNARTVGIAPPNRPGTQRCVMTATVSVERAIANGSKALTAQLPATESFQRQFAGSCRQTEAKLAKLVNDKAQAIDTHIAKTASADHHNAIAAIDAAHQFAAN